MNPFVSHLKLVGIQFVGASMGTSQLKIPKKGSTSSSCDGRTAPNE
jgi:hypothetical protein